MNKYKTIAWIGVTLLALMVVIAAPQATVKVSAAEQPPDEALIADAKNYAAYYGVSLEKAIQRLELQGSAGELDATLTTKEEATFAGAWIQHIPDYRIIVQFTDGNKERILPYIKNGLLANFVEVRTAPVSLARLKPSVSISGETTPAYNSV